MPHRPREISIPARAFDHLRAILVQEAGESAGVHALHAAGFSTGESIQALIDGSEVGADGQVAADTFWRRLREFFQARGWGTLEHEARHPGVSVLASSDWAEAEEHGGAHPTCAFTSGVLSYLLTEAAGSPVAVLETACQARGDERCEFAFGSENTIQRLYSSLLEGSSLDEALARL